MNEIINSSTLRQGAAPWNTEIVSFNKNVKLDLWGQSANDVLKIRRVRVQDGTIIHTSNQTCCITPATKAVVKSSKVVLRCDCDGSRPAELTTDVTSIILSAGAYVFEYSGSGFAAKTTVLTYEESEKEACDCACAQAPCLPVSITTAATSETSATVTIVSGSDAYGREVTVKLFNGENEYEQIGVNGDVLTFAGLSPETTYSVVATNDCGKKDSKQVTTNECPPCPQVTITATADGTNSIRVTVTSIEPAWVELNGEKRYIAGGQSTIFTGLDTSSEYFATATNDCGSMATASATTASCPAISLTQTTNTTSSVTVTLASGGSASVFVGGEEVVLANGGTHTFTDLTAGKTYTAKVVSECGNKATFPLTTAACPAVDFTATAISTTSLQVTATAGMPLDVSIVSQGGAVLDSITGLTSTIVFTDLPDGAIVTVKTVNECGKKKQVNVKLPATPVVVSPCPSFSLADTSPAFKGFAYITGDLIDPAATVPFRGGFIYPTAGQGHTVKVTDALGAVIGYAANKSDCANPCCAPVNNRTSVDGTVIDDSVNNYYIEGEVNKCDGTPVTPTDRLFNKGSLKTCVNGALVDLDCNMIVKTIPDCLEPPPCEINTWITQDSQLSGGGVCIGVGVNSYGGGKAIAQMRDFVSIEGDVSFSGSNPPTHLPYTYTNNTGCSVLFEAFLTGHTNAAALGSTGTMGAAYNIGDVLAYALPNSFAMNAGGTDPGTMRHTFAVRNPTGDGAGSVFHEETVSGARYRKVLPVGASVTVYAQAWVIFAQSDPLSNGTIIHTNMQLDIKVTKGAAYL